MSSPEIFYEEKGSPDLPKIVFLHGLLGSSRNWRAVAKALSDQRHVFSLDLRNHGKSFHSSDASVRAMAGDLLGWLDALVESLVENEEVLGARLTGGGFGGAVLAWTTTEFQQEDADGIASSYESRFGQVPRTHCFAPSKGATIEDWRKTQG